MNEQILNEEFEEIVIEAYNNLPKIFLSRIDNVEVIIEDYPGEEQRNFAKGGLLLGLYTGTPLNKRGHYYGSYPTLPDRITLFRKNILKVCPDRAFMKEKIYEVLFHEIGHYFGMNEEEIYEAMKNFRLNDFKSIE